MADNQATQNPQDAYHLFVRYVLAGDYKTAASSLRAGNPSDLSMRVIVDVPELRENPHAKDFYKELRGNPGAAADLLYDPGKERPDDGVAEALREAYCQAIGQIYERSAVPRSTDLRSLVDAAKANLEKKRKKEVAPVEEPAATVEEVIALLVQRR